MRHVVPIIALAQLLASLTGCSGARTSAACQEQEWDKRVAIERKLEMRYPESDYLTGLGEGRDYNSAVQAATAALSRKVSVVIESELKDARSFYRKSESSSYVETLDEVVVSHTAFSYGSLIESDAADASPWCGRFLAVVRADRAALMEEMGRKLAELSTRTTAAARAALEAAGKGETKPFMAGYRDFKGLLAELEVEAAQLRAVSRGMPQELAGARELMGELETAGRKLRDSLKPCLDITREGEVPEESVTRAADALSQAFGKQGLPGTIGNCSDGDGLWLAGMLLKARCTTGAASAVCAGVVVATIIERHTGTVLATFEMEGKPERGRYSEAEATGASFDGLFENEELPEMLRSHVQHLIPLNSPPSASPPSR